MVYSRRQVEEAAKGRWHEVLSMIGFSQTHLSGKAGPCPNCSTGDGDRFNFTDICKANPTDGRIGWAYCRGCGDGSGWHWVKKMENLTGADAVEFVAKILGVPELQAKGSGDNSETLKSELIIPVPEEAFGWVDQPNKKIRFYNKKLKNEYPTRFYDRKFVYVYPYHDASGDIIGLASRFQNKDSSKRTPMLAWQEFENGDIGWAEASFPEPRPLFGLRSLLPEGKVYIVEGEKCQRALEKLIGNNVLTWTCGAKSWKIHDWSILANRELIFIPDLDQRSQIPKGKLGYEVMQDIAKHLGKPFRAIIFKNVKRVHGYDVADAIDEGMLKKQFEILASRADVYNPDDKRLIETSLPLEIEPDPILEIASFPELPENPEQLQSNDYFRELGFDEDFFYFYLKGFQSVKGFKRESLNEGAIIQLAPLAYWQAVYAKKNAAGYDSNAVRDDLVRGCEKKGHFDYSRIRRRGVYLDKNRIIVNLGNKLIVDGSEVDFLTLNSKYVYTSGPAMDVDLSKMATEAEAEELLKILQLLDLGSESEAYLLLGWITLAGIGSALSWRPHLWLNAAFQSGKSWVLNSIVLPILGDFALATLQGTTEAFFRQQKGDNLAVIFDEAEASTPTEKLRMNSILALMRNSSTDSKFIIGKGSKDNRAATFTIKSMFMFASISFAPTGAADKSRITNINLKPREAFTAADIEKKNEKFKQIRERVANLNLAEQGTRFVSRAIYNIRLINYNKAIMIKAIEKITGHRRVADQYGSLLAGAYTMLYESELDIEMAEAWILNTGIQIQEYETNTADSDELDILQVLLQYEVFINREHGGVEKLTIGQCLERIKNAELTDSMEPIKETLAAKGIKYNPSHLEPLNEVYIARRSPALAVIFSSTAAQSNWEVYLKRLPFAEKALSEPMHFSTSLGGTQRAIILKDSFILGGQKWLKKTYLNEN